MKKSKVFIFIIAIMLLIASHVYAADYATEPDAEILLQNIKIETAPTKTEYKVGEKFDKTGMVVTAEYNDGTTKEVADYTYSPEGKLAELNTKITVTYKEGDVTKTAEQTIKVTSGTTNGTDQEKTDGDLPYTGVENYYIVIAMIAIIGVVSLVSYKKIKIK